MTPPSALHNWDEAATSARQHHQTNHPLNALRSPSEQNHSEGKTLDSSLTKITRTFRGEPRAKTSSHRDWLKAQVEQEPPKVLAEKLPRLSPRAIENVRLGRNSFSFENFTDLCIADPDFGAKFAEYIGVLKPGEAEVAGALTKALNAYQRMKGQSE